MSEELIIRHCSPTLAGIKTGNLFRCSYTSEKSLRDEICSLNRKLAAKGLCFLPLAVSEGDALIYLYRPARLKADLSCKEAGHILTQRGYPPETPARCLTRLRDRLQESADFPHEIGLFLGYPPEDVSGFIRKETPKCVGYWKVYGDAEKAKETFDSYKKCTENYTRRLQGGYSLEKLAVGA